MNSDTNTPDSTKAPLGEPRKYIRTLAGDMETLKKGGAPDLTPLEESKSSPAERLVEASPAISDASPTSNLGPLPEFAVDTTKSRIPIPNVEPPPTPIQTYASDFHDRVKDTHASPATVLAAEQDAPVPKIVKPEEKHSHNFLYISAGALLLIAGVFGIYIAYTRNMNAPAPEVTVPTISAPIFAEDKEQISGTGIALLQAITKSVDRKLTAGMIRFLYTENVTNDNDSVFTALQLPAPDVVLRNLNADGSMAGVINIKGEQSPFFVLSVSSYGETFSGMLSWERVMPRDLGVLFPAYPAPAAPIASLATTTATTTPKAINKTASTTHATAASSTPAFIAGFRDEVVNNHDVRVYRDAQKRSILLYGYWNQRTLIIAREPSAFTEILNRLASARAQS